MAVKRGRYCRASSAEWKNNRPNGLFARILRCFPLQSVRIAAENRLVCGAKILVMRRTLLTKTASETGKIPF